MSELNALIPIHNGYTDSEFIYAYYRLMEAGVNVYVATTDGHPVVGEEGTKQSRICKVNFDLRDPLMKDSDGYDILCLVGGVKSIEKLRLNKCLIKLIKNYALNFNHPCVIASICHGAQLLIEADVIRHLTGSVSGYYSIQRDIENAGGMYSRDVSVAYKSSNITVVSASHYNQNHLWMKEVIGNTGIGYR